MKSPYPAPEPTSWRDRPTVVLLDSKTPISVEVVPSAGPSAALILAGRGKRCKEACQGRHGTLMLPSFFLSLCVGGVRASSAGIGASFHTAEHKKIPETDGDESGHES